MRRFAPDGGAGLLPRPRPASQRTAGPGSKTWLLAILFMLLGAQAFWMLRGQGFLSGDREPARTSSAVVALSDARPSALLLFLGRDYCLVRRSVGFAWTFDRLRSSAPHHLTPTQLEEVRPLVEMLVEDARAEQDSILGLRAILTPEQVAFLNNPSGIHPSDLFGATRPDLLPSESFKKLLKALQVRAAGVDPSDARPGGEAPARGLVGLARVSPVPGDEAGVCVPSAPGRNAAPALVSRWSDFLERPPQLADWLVAMDGRKDLAFSADQARQMLPLVKRLIAAVERYDATTVRFTAALTGGQLAYLRSEFCKRGIPDFVVVNLLSELLPPR